MGNVEFHYGQLAGELLSFPSFILPITNHRLLITNSTASSEPEHLNSADQSATQTEEVERLFFGQVYRGAGW
jgi:hypothetical protein